MARKEESETLSSYWRQQIDAWKASGQSQSAFCQSNDLSYHRFGYWHRKFLGQGNNGVRSGFVPVSQRAVPEPTGLSIVLPRGVVVQGIAADNLAVVYQLLKHFDLSKCGK